MFMDPSEFEAEDIERELRDAGVEPETTTGGPTSEFQQPINGGRENPLRLPGKSSTAAPPSSGSHFGLNSGSVPEGKRARKSGVDGWGTLIFRPVA